VVEDGLTLLGLTLKMVVFQLDGFTTHQIGASLTVLLLAIIIQLENSSHVEL
jgi:hypothetical protein